jgi:hypothetical protein
VGKDMVFTKVFGTAVLIALLSAAYLLVARPYGHSLALHSDGA